MKLKKILGLGVVALGCLTLGVCTSQFFKDGFNKIKDKIDEVIPSTTTKPVEDNKSEDTVLVDGKEVKTGSVVDMPSKLTFRKNSAHTDGIIIKATVLPENATNKNLVWSFRWFNETDATNKGLGPASDYLSLTKRTDGSVSIKCLQPFNSKICVEVEPEGNSDIVATIDVEFATYLKSYELYQYVVYNDDSRDRFETTFEFDLNTGEFNLTEDSVPLFSQFKFWNPLNDNINSYNLNKYSNIHNIEFGQVVDELDRTNYISKGSVFTDLNNCVLATSYPCTQNNLAYYSDGCDYFGLSLSRGLYDALHEYQDADDVDLYQFLKPEFKSSKEVYFYLDDTVFESNLFELFFDTSNMTSAQADKIIKVMEEFSKTDNILRLYNNFVVYDYDTSTGNPVVGTTCYRTQYFEYEFNVEVSTYVPVSQIVVDTDNVVLQ